MPEKLPATGVTPRGLDYLRPKPKQRKRRLPANAAALALTLIPTRREVAQMVAEEDNSYGRRERMTIYEYGQPPVIDDIGPATGQPPVAVPLGGQSAVEEGLDLMLENAERPRYRENRPDVKRDFEEQVNRTLFRGTTKRRVFGVPARKWKGE